MNLAQPNYRAWLVNEGDYPKNGSLREKLSFLLKYAILAPSAHNTQPWLFGVNNSEIKVFIDKKRALKESDLEQRQTYESIGTCLTNLRVAAEHFGFSTEVEYMVNGGGEDESKKLAAKVALTPGIGAEPHEDLFDYITKRHSAKLEYVNEQVSQEALVKLQNLNSFPELKLNLYNTAEVLQGATEAVILGTEKAFSDKAFCVELSHWLRNNYTKQPDGMPGFTVGMPSPISLLAPFMVRHFNTVKMQTDMAKKSMLATTAFGVISGENNGLNWIKAGELFEKVALSALQNGLNTAPMGAPIEINEAAEMLRIKLNLVKRPLLFFRVGRQKHSLFTSPRRLYGEFIVE